ncbi:MAG: type II toxin-antitoxin system VapC family toxin [Planctomycetes bacterium]|nr:type II toxin-antitoxin system VapC family toxin [Planctomycetota bacterium]
MKKKAKVSRVLVIDACVARAAGENDHPESSSCRTFLESVLQICHKVAMNKVIKHEWNTHGSDFSLLWLAAMTDKRKVVELDEVADVPLDMSRFKQNQKVVVEKDIHILKAAHATGSEIVTLDKKLIKALGATEEGMGLRDRIAWHHPVNDGVRKL